jgi:hypothetical protein
MSALGWLESDCVDSTFPRTSRIKLITAIIHSCFFSHQKIIQPTLIWEEEIALGCLSPCGLWGPLIKTYLFGVLGSLILSCPGDMEGCSMNNIDFVSQKSWVPVLPLLTVWPRAHKWPILILCFLLYKNWVNEILPVDLTLW